jgi:O-antigen ligase
VALTRRIAGGAPLVALLGTSGLLVGVLAVKKPSMAAALVLAAALVVVIAIRIEALPLALVSTIFIEEVALGGLTVGRIAGVLALAAISYHMLAQGKLSLRMSPLLAVAGAYGFWLLLSFYWADDPHAVFTTFFGFLLVLAYMFTFALLVKTPRDAVSVLTVMVAGSALSGFVALNTYLVSGGSARATGLEGSSHPDTFGVYQAMIVPVALGLFALARRPEIRVAYLGAFAVIAFSIVASLTRTAMISIVIVAVLALCLPWRFMFRSARQKASYVVAVGLMMGLVLTVAATATFASRVSSIFSGWGSSGDRGAGRTDLWAAAFHAYQHHPWFGIGAGNFSSHSLTLLQQTPGVDISASYAQQGRLVHNSYLEALSELGPVGLALLVLVIAIVGWTLWRVFTRARALQDDTTRIVAASLMLSLLGLAISMGFLSIALNKPLWIIAGLALALDRMVDRPSEAAGRTAAR